MTHQFVHPCSGVTDLMQCMLAGSVLNINTLNLDPDPGLRPYLDPDPGPDPDPGLYNQF